MAVYEQLGNEESWPAYKHMILSELASLRTRDDRIDAKLEKILQAQEILRMDIASLQAKSGIWGMLGGLIPVVVALAMLLIGGWGR